LCPWARHLTELPLPLSGYRLVVTGGSLDSKTKKVLSLSPGRGSGVARVPCALGQEIFLRPPSTKLTEFELKSRCKSAEEAKAEHLL